MIAKLTVFTEACFILFLPFPRLSFVDAYKVVVYEFLEQAAYYVR